MASTIRTKAAITAAAFLAGTMLLTACGSDSKGSGDSAKKSETASQAGAKDVVAAKADGVSGTFTGGVISYLAPGKHIVSTNGKDQQFMVADDTKVLGAGTVCGAYNPQSTNPCTVDDLEKALKKGSIGGDVVMKDGIAVSVTERTAPDEGAPVDDSAPTKPGKDQNKGTDKASGGGTDKGTGKGSGGSDRDTVVEGINKGKGVNGTWFGNVTFLAPGKYVVSGANNSEQQFLIADDTKIWGAGDICGDEQGQSATLCTEAQLEAVAKKGGVSAEVIIENGIATKITDDR
ncbi:hypothetical protein [Streptomyces sp. NPDC047315]|uniref:hypothetical protein n=1 Tax=Streptomyces sp. NPDC047315 TaxID=3155142 RepID=UPI0033F072B2